LGIAIQRDSDRDDRRHAQIAQDRVEVGATHRTDAVPSGQGDVDPLGHQLREVGLHEALALVGEMSS
jgi:hypothetical protein